MAPGPGRWGLVSLTQRVGLQDETRSGGGSTADTRGGSPDGRFSDPRAVPDEQVSNASRLWGPEWPAHFVLPAASTPTPRVPGVARSPG